jgi:uncharacterized protein with NAD-binding domain and iron-sulfur cluster
MNTDKLMQYFFIIAAVISILDGAFQVSDQMQSVKFVVLIVSGLFVGLVCHDRQKDFMLSSFVIVITGYIMIQLLGPGLFIQGIGLMLLNFMAFLAAAAVTVAFQVLGTSIAPSLQVSAPEVELKKIKKLNEQEIQHLTFQKTWGTIILVAVAVTFVILLAEFFFDVAEYRQIIFVADIIVTLLFIIDLVILYREAKSFKEFIGNNIFDVIAAIPFFGAASALRAIKVVRAFRIIKILRSSVKVSKVLKVSKTAKLFSEESYFNTVEKDGKLHTTSKHYSQKLKQRLHLRHQEWQQAHLLSSCFFVLWIFSFEQVVLSS